MKKGVLSVLTALTGAAVGAGTLGYQKARQHEQDSKVIKKNYFQKIAIYGMSYAGERLLDDLKGTGIEVVYAVDQNADRMFAEVELITKGEIAHQQEVDAVIVTAIYFFDDIEEEISELVDCPIVS